MEKYTKQVAQVQVQSALSELAREAGPRAKRKERQKQAKEQEQQRRQKRLKELRELETFGCDLGDKTSQVFAIRPDGSQWKPPEPIATTREGFAKFFEGRERAHVVIEVGAHSRWVKKVLESLGHEVTVANARQLPLLTKSDKKSDQRDAELLAKMGRSELDLIEPVTHREDQAQADLAVPKARDLLVRQRTAVINQVRGMIKATGCRVPGCAAEAFHRKASKHVPRELQSAVQPLLVVLEVLDEEIRDYDKQIEKLAKTRYPDVERVSQICGVGVLTGLVFILTLADKRRFPSSRDVGAYIGLVPQKSQSGEKDPQLPITKAGDELLRRLLVQDANYILGPLCRQDSDLQRWGRKLCARGGKSAYKRAKVALARKLGVVMHRLWTTGEDYEPLGYHQKTQKARKEARAAQAAAQPTEKPVEQKLQ